MMNLLDTPETEHFLPVHKVSYRCYFSGFHNSLQEKILILFT